MTSKEALEKIENYLKYVPYAINYLEEHNAIKQDLERFEECKNENSDYQIKNAELQDKYDDLYEKFKMLNDSNIKLDKENEKLKQALKILKDKKVDIDMFIDSSSVEDYNKRLEYYTYINPEVRPLTKEEYELLKEVLGNENSNL